jgi:hypothetical protein
LAAVVGNIAGVADRILVYGVTGSGKTTIARQIAARTGLPWHEVDNLTWEPGWVIVPVEEQRRRIEEICAGERWILDTAYNLDHQPICNGNTESLRQTFSRDSIILWHFQSFARKRDRIRAWAADDSGPDLVRLTSPAAARRWLDGLTRVAAPGEVEATAE